MTSKVYLSITLKYQTLSQDLTNTGRQFKLEAEAARLGAERFRERTRLDEEREYSSGTLWGRKLIQQQIGAISQQIELSAKKVRLGAAVAGGVRIMDTIRQIEPEVLAAIAAKRTLDQIGMGRDQKGRYKHTYAKVCTTIGAAVEAEARFRWYEKTAPDEWGSIKNRYFKATTGTQQKARVASLMMNRRGFVWNRWTEPKKFSVGAWLFNCIAETVHWFDLEMRNTKANGKGRMNLVLISPQLVDLKAVINELAELASPLTWPMVTAPADWTATTKGGYLTNEIRQQFSLIRGAKGPSTLGTTPIDMLNTLQRVPYRVNPVVIQLMNDLYERELDLGSFITSSHIPTPPKPQTEDEEVVFQWRKECTEIYTRMASLKGRCYRTLETLQTANRFKDEPEIFLPWSYDWRGRVYPIPTFMSIQGTDMEKALYLFAKERPVTEDAKRWLAIQVANCAGKDKLPLDERVAWAHDNVSLIRRIAEDPLHHLGELSAFDEPWVGYASCVEFIACVIDCTQQTTSQPVATDATCSGLQHLSAMTLDAKTGHLVNVSPTPHPQDAYKAVLNETIRLLRINRPELADWAEEVGRPLAKRVVMTVPYAAEERSNRGYILKAIKDHEHDKPRELQRRISSEELGIITKTMLRAMKFIVPGPLAVMEWAKKAAREALSQEDRETIEWTSPSGFPVIQDKRKLNIVRVKTQLLGDVVKTMVGNGFKEVAVTKHMSGIMPNFIHSCDAALLHNSFAGFDQPFTLIHDSILTTASDMGYMSAVIRDEFVKIYEERPLEMLADVLGVPLPEDMIVGDMDITRCRESIYFFC